LQPSVLFLQLAQSPGLVHFQAPVLRLPVVERGVADPHPAAEVFHRNSCLRLLQHPDDLLFTKAAPFHGASPLVVLYPEKLSFGWTKFRGAGHFVRYLEILSSVFSALLLSPLNNNRRVVSIILWVVFPAIICRH